MLFRSNAGAGVSGPGALDGTMWCSDVEHDRVAVDNRGNADFKKGKHLFLQFPGPSDGYVVKISWWNESQSTRVAEWAVAVPVGENGLTYQEANQDENPNFTGIIGHGDLTLVSGEAREISQVGHLVNGSAAGFSSTLQRVDQMPDIPVPVTYPAP